MKYLLNILVIFSFSFILVGCGDDDYDEQPLSIVKSVQEFEAVGGNQKVTLEGIENATIQSDQEWCKATLSGNTLSIDVPANNSFEGRTAQLTLKLTNQRVFVNVYQKANLFWIEGLDFLNKDLIFSRDGESLENLVVKSNLPVEISKSADWIKYTYTDGILVISAGKADEVRQGTITFKSGDREETFTITQIAMPYESYLGEWDIAYINNSTGALVQGKATLSQKVEGESYKISSSSIMLPFTLHYNADTQSLLITAGELVGLNGTTHYIVTGLISTEGYITFDSELQIEATPRLEDVLICQFVDNGSWADEEQVIDRFQYSAINQSDGKYAGGFATYRNITLTR